MGKKENPCLIRSVCCHQRVPLSDMTRSEINELLRKLGFYKKTNSSEEVPEEFRFSPAKDSPFKDEATSTSTSTMETTSHETQTEAQRTDL